VHRKLEVHDYEQRRGSSARRGYGGKWLEAARRFLIAHPWCIKCSRLASEVDHIIPHKGDMKLFWDRKNWQSLCKECHSRKTAAEDGRWKKRRETHKPCASLD
jgi:5-methylcytosine-specific restriction protein A